jgi:hypothetical protein
MELRNMHLQWLRIIATTLLGLIAAAFVAPTPATAAETYDTPAAKGIVAGAKATRPVPAGDPRLDTARKVSTPASDRPTTAPEPRKSSQDIAALQVLVHALQSRVAATSDATHQSRDALVSENGARIKAEQEAQRLRETLPPLQAEVIATRRENNDLHQEVAQLGKQLSVSEQARGVARQTMRTLNTRIASLAPELQTTRAALTAAQAASRDASQRADAAEARGATAATALARLRQQLVLWVGGAALLGAGAGGIAARMLSPRPRVVAQPMTVSARLGEWTVASAIGDAGAARAFQIRTRWLPGRSDVAASASLLRRPNLTAVHGVAA